VQAFGPPADRDYLLTLWRETDMNRIALLLLAASFPLGLVGCNGSDSEVPSGTYSGTIKKVNADEKEIYVEADVDGQTRELELYFTDATKLVGPAGVDAAFDVLTEGMSVEVKVENKDGRLVPVEVRPKM
jgi:cold shock protein